MPDLGKVHRGVDTGLSDIHRAFAEIAPGQDGTWIHNTQVTRTWFLVDCKTNDTMVTRRGDPLYRSDETMVMVQEDQAGEPWSSYYSLYTIDEGFKAPPEP